MKIKLNMQIEFTDGCIGEMELRLLFLISKLGSLKAAAKHEQISYKNAWDKLRKASELAKEPLLDASSKKSGAKLTEFGKMLLFKWEEFNEFAEKIGDDFQPKISAQNVLKGKISSLSENSRGALVGIECEGQTFYALISQYGLKELALKLNQSVSFVFKIYCLKHCSVGAKAHDNHFIAQVESCERLAEDYACNIKLGNTKLRAISAKALAAGSLEYFSVSRASIIIML